MLARSSEGRQGLRAWGVPFAIAGAIVAWAALLYTVIGSKPRAWAYGTLPYVPAESAYSSERPQAGPAPQQVLPLPAAPKGGR